MAARAARACAVVCAGACVSAAVALAVQPATAQAATWNPNTGTYTFEQAKELKAMASKADGQWGVRGAWPKATSTVTGEQVSVSAASVKKVVVAAGITLVPANTFYKQTFASVSIPPSVKTVGKYAFGECKKLKKVSLPGVKKLGDYAFDKCVKLAGVKVPKVTSVGSYCFEGCAALTSVTLKKATTLKSGAFLDCAKIKKARLSKVQKIGYTAFQGCTALKTVTITSTKLKSVAAGAFAVGKRSLSIRVPKARRVQYARLIAKGKANLMQACLSTVTSTITVTGV